MRKSVIFDLGQVMIEWRAFDALSHRYATEAEMWRDLEARGFGAWNLEQDRGRTWDDALAAVADPQTRAIFADYAAGIDLAHAKAIESSVEILAGLRAQGLRLFVLSNMSREGAAAMHRHHEFMTWFEGVVFSAEEGLIKPDPALYQRLLSRFNVDPATAFFIDDRPENVETARQLGMSGHVYSGPEGLRQALGAWGATC